MEEKIRLAVFGQKRLSREGGIEIQFIQALLEANELAVGKDYQFKIHFTFENVLADYAE